MLSSAIPQDTDAYKVAGHEVHNHRYNVFLIRAVVLAGGPTRCNPARKIAEEERELFQRVG